MIRIGWQRRRRGFGCIRDGATTKIMRIARKEINCGKRKPIKKEDIRKQQEESITVLTNWPIVSDLTVAIKVVS
jgi:hypothetical protein